MSARYTHAKIFKSKAIGLTESVRRAKFGMVWLRFHGVDHSGTSYEGRVFFNNPKADENTPKTVDSGYAGNFHIFGHGRCYGDEGHCDAFGKRRDFDFRSPHPLTPREVQVEVSDALRRVALSSAKLFVTVVPVIAIDPKAETSKDCFHFNKLSVLVRSSHDLLAAPIDRLRPGRQTTATVAVSPKSQTKARKPRRKR
jgi:tyrosinase